MALALERFFANTLAEWDQLERAFMACGADEDLVLDIRLIRRRIRAVKRIDIEGALQRAAVRSTAQARFLTQARDVFERDAAKKPA